MAFINQNTNFMLDVKLSNKDSYDLVLSNSGKVCNCDVLNEPIICIQFNNNKSVCSDDIWVDSISSQVLIPDFGITGYDNRFLSSYGEDLQLSNNKHFCMFGVDGENYDYTILSGTPTQLCGGFYQGFYGLEGYNYQTLPKYFKEGWTAEFYLLNNNCSISGTTNLNDAYPNNSGIFYYYGARAENKFCSLKEHLLSYEVFSGETFLESTIKTTSHITAPEDTNPFLFYNCSGITEFYANATGVTFTLQDCCDSLKYNALAFRITPDGKIGYRYLGSSGTCVNMKYEEDFQIFEKYSLENVITDENYHLVTIKFKNDDYLECIPKKQTFGTLSIYVDGFLKLRETNFPNIIPYSFDDLPSKQLGVPFNISVGGGTQGLLEMQFDQTETFNLCDYKFYVRKDQFFKGVKVDGIEYHTPVDYNFQNIEEILNFLNEKIPNKFSKIFVNYELNYTEFLLKLVYNDFQDIFYSFELDYNSTDTCCTTIFPEYIQATPFKENCFTFTTDNNSCGILEENFAGTFIGKINTFCLYDLPLDFQNIRCNFNEAYNI